MIAEVFNHDPTVEIANFPEEFRYEVEMDCQLLRKIVSEYPGNIQENDPAVGPPVTEADVPKVPRTRGRSVFDPEEDP